MAKTEKISTMIDVYEVMVDDFHTRTLYDVKYQDVILLNRGDDDIAWISFQIFESYETAVAVSRLIEQRKIVPFSVTRSRR